MSLFSRFAGEVENWRATGGLRNPHTALDDVGWSLRRVELQETIDKDARRSEGCRCADRQRQRELAARNTLMSLAFPLPTLCSSEEEGLWDARKGRERRPLE